MYMHIHIYIYTYTCIYSSISLSLSIYIYIYIIYILWSSAVALARKLDARFLKQMKFMSIVQVYSHNLILT